MAAASAVSDAKAQSKREPPDINTSSEIGAMHQRSYRIKRNRRRGNALYGYGGSKSLRCFQTPRWDAMMDFDSGRCAVCACPTTLLSSSMAEHPAVNRRVVGSSPT